jgi:hypothetical protein
MKRTRFTQCPAVQMIERLEERRLFSGVVTATLDNTGLLLIKGDNANNSIEVEAYSNPGFIRVRGNATAVNGVAFQDFAATSVRAISIQLGGGSDAANVHDMENGPGGSTPSLHSITVTDDAGNDQYFFFSLTLSAGSLSATTGANFDFIEMSDVTVGSLSVDTGSTADSIDATNIEAGSASILTGDNNDFLTLRDSDFGSLSVDTGKGDDNATLSNIFVSSSINVKLGDGDDFIEVGDTVAGFGVIDGGKGTDVFQDDGGNAGFSVINFEGFI